MANIGAAIPGSAGVSPAFGQRTRCEIWTRVMGYHRPVHAWNPGKRQEHRDRLHFREPHCVIPAGGAGIQAPGTDPNVSTACLPCHG